MLHSLDVGPDFATREWSGSASISYASRVGGSAISPLIYVQQEPFMKYAPLFFGLALVVGCVNESESASGTSTPVTNSSKGDRVGGDRAPISAGGLEFMRSPKRRLAIENRLPEVMPFEENEECSRHVPEGIDELHIATREGVYPAMFDVQTESGGESPDAFGEKVLTGSEIEMAMAVCDIVGVDCHFYLTIWDKGCCQFDDDEDGVPETFRPPTYKDSSLLGSVYEGIYDMSVGAHSLKPDRIFFMPVSAPVDKVSGGALIVGRAGFAADHLDISLAGDGRTGLAGVKVGFMPGTTHAAYMQDRYPDAEFIEGASTPALVEMLLAGEIKVFLDGTFSLLSVPAFESGEIEAITNSGFTDGEIVVANINETDPDGELFHYGPGSMWVYSPYLETGMTRAIDCAIRAMNADDRGINESLKFVHPDHDSIVPRTDDSYAWFRSLNYTPYR